MFVPVGNAEAWAQGVKGLLADQQRRETMMEEGRRVAERHAWPAIAQRVLGVYKRVTA